MLRTLDRLGVYVSSACAVHCAVMPFLGGLLAFAGVGGFLDEPLELMLLSTSAALGLLSLLPSYWHHRRITPLAVFSLAFGALIGTHWLPETAPAWIGPAIAVAGGVGMAWAHRVNLRLRHVKKACEHGCTH